MTVTFEQSVLTCVSLAAVAVLATMGVVVCVKELQLPAIRQSLRDLRRLPWYAQLFLVAFVSHLVVYGSVKTNQTNSAGGDATNSPPAMLMAPRPAVASAVGCGSQDLQPHTFPHWWHGVYEDGQRVGFDEDWVFPSGTNHLASVEVMAWGEILPNGFSTTPIAALGCRVSLVPEVSEFHYCRTPSNSYQFVWNNARDRRINGSPISGCIELFRNGDVVVGTNGVGTVTPYVIPFHHDGFGQDEVWVRANFTNAEEILSAGYANWVDDQIGVGLTNGLFKFTAYFPEVPPEATELVVGDYSVCVTNSGEYVFVFEKGNEYSFHTEPYDETVEYSMQDDFAPLAPVFKSMWGGEPPYEWSIDGGGYWLDYPGYGYFGHFGWLPTLQGSPTVMHLGPDEESLTFTAVLSDYRYAEGVAYHWTCEDGNVVIASPNSRETQVTFTTMPSWASATLTVTATVGTNELCSTLSGFTYGTNDTPQVYFDFSVPNAVLLNSNRTDNAKLGRLSLSFSSDDDRRGSLRLSCTSGEDRIALWGTSNGTMGVSLPMTWNAGDFPGFEAYVEGIGTSESIDDVQLKAEFIPDEGDIEELVRDLTVVEVGDVSLPGAPNDGLVVSTGTSVAFDLNVLPKGAKDRLSVVYNVRRLRGNGSYSDWEYATGSCHGTDAVYNPLSGGIYQVQALAGVGSDAVNERYYVWEADEAVGVGIKESGDLKAFGVCDEEWQKTLRNLAKENVGSTLYAKDAALPADAVFSSVPRRRWKCNAFVARMIIAAGLPLDPRHTTLSGNYPPSANDWANGSIINHWRYLGRSPYLQPGFVVGHPASQSGHCGIVDFDGEAIAAGRENVNRAYGMWLDATSGYDKKVEEDWNE